MDINNNNNNNNNINNNDNINPGSNRQNKKQAAQEKDKKLNRTQIAKACVTLTNYGLCKMATE